MDENTILFGKHIKLGEKNIIIYCCECPPLGWHYNQGKCVESRDVGHAHFRLTFFSGNVPPRQFHRFAPNFALSDKDLSKDVPKNSQVIT